MCEAQINGYKKKLEDYNDLKKHLKLLEERSADYVQQNVQFEEDVKKCAAIKGQVELYKKEIQELHVKLDQEMSKNVKVEFENKNMECTITALERSKDNLLKERDNLREIIDELKCGETLKTMSKELQPTDLLQKLQRLEIDNKILREGQGSHAALVQLLNDANKRNENLREQLKSANERNLAITHSSFSVDANSKCNELAKQLKQLMELNEQKAIHLDEALNQNAVLQTKISQLENSLSGREQELVICDTKFRKCLEKAKEIIKNMDPRSDMNILEQTQNLDDFQKAKPSMLEENLMTTAFYRICVNAQKDAIDSKLALLMGQRHTFLSRQRQSAPRSLTTCLFMDDQTKLKTDAVQCSSNKLDKALLALKVRRTVTEQQIDRVSLDELNIKLKALDSAFDAFNKVQTKIEEKILMKSLNQIDRNVKNYITV
ncbi:hypothetical protein GQX74_009378 [Glossina fuscipes]|nr:hypothetical protein GQX74_009378 [Glossina fuscipes]